MMDMVQEPALHGDKAQHARRLAEEKYRTESDWVRYYREVLGVDGLIAQLFPSFDQRNQFHKTTEYAEIQQMLAKLRERNRVQKDCDEPTRVITVRLPRSLHEALRHEAHNHRTSMNKLCISKLLQMIEGELVPSDFERQEDEAGALEPIRTPVAAAIPIQPTFQGAGFSVPAPTLGLQPSQPQSTALSGPVSSSSLHGGTSF